MKKLLAICAISLLAASHAVAAPQHERMKMCNKEAGEKSLKGDERKAFMKSCLSNKPASEEGKPTQQNKMKACNMEAGEKNLKGAERKAFMKTCLSNK